MSRKNVRTRIIKTKNNRKMEEIFSVENGKSKLSVYYDGEEQEFLFEIEDSHKEYHDIWLTGNGVAGLTSALDEFLHLTE